ncbi:hypothetical protein [Sporosarcina sp. D27]|uniref:hypothetical protein n=1 Tax=Sporosarcina sp. D27 TaxID=1382305 RepID=UPI00047240A8|nr:hypothetical protein [Sporosarcina sp. D27]
MKRILLAICVIALFGIAYTYQSPILETNQAIDQAKKHVVTPPEEWQASFPKVEEQVIPWKVIRVELVKRQGFWNELMNKQKWEVTMEYERMQATIVLNAYTGEFMEIYGPLN